MLPAVKPRSVNTTKPYFDTLPSARDMALPYEETKPLIGSEQHSETAGAKSRENCPPRENKTKSHEQTQQDTFFSPLG